MSNDIRHITDQSELYPSLLREINKPPQELYFRGDISLLENKLLLAVVGSRKSSAYGKLCVQKLLPKAIENGVIVVSGLAFGIDSLAHQACVDQKKPTIAVLGSGIDDASIYPRNHVRLAKQILEHGGLLISEYPPETPSYPSNFPERNRIIAGLCQATLIIQATDRSGSLITARLALESNRDVWVVPGCINDPLSYGTNKLLQQGAAPITSPDDILFMFNIEQKNQKTTAKTPELSGDAKLIWNYLTDEPQHIDNLAAATKLDIPSLSATLIQLELQNLIQHVGGMRYSKKILN